MSALVVAALGATAVPARAANPLCDGSTSTGDKILCNGITGVIIIAGGAVLAKEAVMNAITPGTNVEVELDDGRAVPGVVTAKAASGRTVKTGDRVRLDCASPYGKHPDGSKQCSLRFLRKEYMRSLYPRNNPLYGTQPDWSIYVDPHGMPDDNLLRLQKK